MIEKMTEEEMDELLQRSIYAHMGCQMPNEKIHVYPITYVYDKGVVYGFSYPGTKMDIVTKNPKVCLQVEDSSAPHRWSSVMAWGNLSIVPDDKAARVIKLLHSQLLEENRKGNLVYEPFKNTSNTFLDPIQRSEQIVFQIKIVEKTGRFEQYSY